MEAMSFSLQLFFDELIASDYRNGKFYEPFHV